MENCQNENFMEKQTPTEKESSQELNKYDKLMPTAVHQPNTQVNRTNSKQSTYLSVDRKDVSQ